MTHLHTFPDLPRTVAGMEKPGRDLKLSSLKRYIEAIGGRLRLDIELPDGTHYGFSV